jgi:hypothetical protein
MGLEDEANFLIPQGGQRVWVQLSQIPAVQNHLAGRRVIECTDDLQQSAFTRT